MTYTATYSPEDDKIRLSASTRLDADLYARVKAAGFRWAPMQKVFYAVWTPKAEDIALELAGEIDDEDKTLVERAEERADRFEDYSESRKEDAERAHNAVHAIADHIPFGQPILVGHHSEKHARRDAEKIENGMRKAVKMWDQSQYWKQRAAGALRHAKYKELPEVRARRIKTLEAELRRIVASYTPLVTKDRPNPQYIKQERWNATRTGTTEPVMHVWVGPPGRGGTWTPVEDLPKIKASYVRYEEHLMNRLEYETAMLGEQIGVDSFSRRFDYQVGGKITTGREELLTILKLNKKDGEIVSVSTNSRRWTRVVQVEEIQTYEPPAEGVTENIKAATKRPTLCNYPGEGFATCTAQEWKRINKDYKSQSHVIPATDEHGAHCVRWALGVYVTRPAVIEGKDETARYNQRHSYFPVFVTDMPRKDPPAKAVDAPTLPAVEHNDEAIAAKLDRIIAHNQERESERAEAAPFEKLKDSLKTGVQVVTANQLFPTPPDLCRRLCEEGDVQPGQRVLEPSAGTGNLVKAVFAAFTGADCGRVTAIEINPRVAETLRADRNLRANANESNYEIRCADFLECAHEAMGLFDRILMNPPFENGADIKHIQHARTFLKPGGRLVAICANGPRQQDQLQPLADSWEELPAGTFAGTGVRTVLLTIQAPAEIQRPALGENAAEAQRMTYAGRGMTALRHAKTFDQERLEASPLFKPTMPTLF